MYWHKKYLSFFCCRLLTDEITEPNSTDARLYLKKNYRYDGFGNITHTTVCSYHFQNNCGTASGSQISTISDSTKIYRQDSTSYDASSRYVVTTSNLVSSNLTHVTARNPWGQILSVQDIDGKIAENRYDSFGALYFSKDNTGGASTITRKLKTQAQTANWPNITEPYYFATQVIAMGKPITYTYTNKLGQQVASVTQGFTAGTWIYQFTRYDQLGRVVRQSLPLYADGTLQWQRTSYDRLGRPIKTINGDGSSESDITYSGLSTVTTTNVNNDNYGSDSNQKTQITNALGEVISVTDNQGIIE